MVMSRMLMELTLLLTPIMGSQWDFWEQLSQLLTICVSFWVNYIFSRILSRKRKKDPRYFMVFRNKEKYYPIWGVTDDKRGILYRSGSKGRWMWPLHHIGGTNERSSDLFLRVGKALSFLKFSEGTILLLPWILLLVYCEPKSYIYIPTSLNLFSLLFQLLFKRSILSVLVTGRPTRWGW